MYFELQELDRAFYEYLRVELVRSNLLPDISVLSKADFLLQLKAMIDSPNSKVIEIFGVGDVKARGQVNVNKIVVDRIDMSPANLGAYNTKHYERTSPTTYKKLARPAKTYNVTYQIGFVTDNTKDDRFLNMLIMSVFDAMGCKNGIKDDFTKTENFFSYRQSDFKDNSNGDYFERISRYTVDDVFIIADKIESENIGVLTNVEIETGSIKDNE